MSIENTVTPIKVITFASLGLNPLILNAVEESGYTVPSPIQAEAIPILLQGRPKPFLK